VVDLARGRLIFPREQYPLRNMEILL
jgi:hypothetical protein